MARSRRIKVRQLQFVGRCPQLLTQLVNPPTRTSVLGVQIVGVRPSVGHHQYGLVDVIKDHHPVVEGERHVGQPPIILRRLGQHFAVTDHVVTSIPHRSATKSRQAGHWSCLVTDQQ